MVDDLNHSAFDFSSLNLATNRCTVALPYRRSMTRRFTESSSRFIYSDTSDSVADMGQSESGPCLRTVNNTNVAITDAIIISLNTVGGTVGAAPDLKTITGASGFTVACTAADTSTYNYALIKNAA